MWELLHIPFHSHAILLPTVTALTKSFAWLAHLQVGSIVFRNKLWVALRQHHNLLLNIFDLILRLLQVYDFYGNNLQWELNECQYWTVLCFVTVSFASPVVFDYRFPWTPPRKTPCRCAPASWKSAPGRLSEREKEGGTKSLITNRNHSNSFHQSNRTRTLFRPFV